MVVTFLSTGRARVSSQTSAAMDQDGDSLGEPAAQVAQVAQVFPAGFLENNPLFEFRTFFTHTNPQLPMLPMQPLHRGTQQLQRKRLANCTG